MFETQSMRGGQAPDAGEQSLFSQVTNQILPSNFRMHGAERAANENYIGRYEQSPQSDSRGSMPAPQDVRNVRYEGSPPSQDVIRTAQDNISQTYADVKSGWTKPEDKGNVPPWLVVSAEIATLVVCGRIGLKGFSGEGGTIAKEVSGVAEEAMKLVRSFTGASKSGAAEKAAASLRTEARVAESGLSEARVAENGSAKSTLTEGKVSESRITEPAVNGGGSADVVNGGNAADLVSAVEHQATTPHVVKPFDDDFIFPVIRTTEQSKRFMV